MFLSCWWKQCQSSGSWPALLVDKAVQRRDVSVPRKVSEHTICTPRILAVMEGTLMRRPLIAGQLE